MIKISVFLFERVSWAALAPLTGHMRPAGRVFETPGLVDNVPLSIWQTCRRAVVHPPVGKFYSYKAAIPKSLTIWNEIWANDQMATVTKSQYHQHFDSNFFAQKFFCSAFCAWSLCLCFLAHENWRKRWKKWKRYSKNVGEIDSSMRGPAFNFYRTKLPMNNDHL